jgi:2-keto-4-pentenoate hydratase
MRGEEEVSALTISVETRDSLVDRLAAAEAQRHAIPLLTNEFPALDLRNGYAIQAAQIARKVAAGDAIIGHKTGLTSKSKQVQMGVNESIRGVLLASNLLPEPVISVSRFIHPRVEPELGILLGEDLKGPVVTPAHVYAAIRCIFPALEVIDSRYDNFKFTLADVVADNASTAGFVLGAQPLPAAGVDLGLMGVVLEKNGEVVTTGAGAAVLNHPLYAVAWLANTLLASGQHLRAGDIILAGAITAAFAVAPGDTVSAHFSGLGSLCVRVTE